MGRITKVRSPLFWVLGVVLIGFVIAALLFLLNRSVPPRLVALPHPFSPPLSIRERVGQSWLTKWQWGRALANLIPVLPQSKVPKRISCAIFQLDPQTVIPFEEIVGMASEVDVTNGLSVWFLPPIRLNALYPRFETDAHGKVYRLTATTFEGTRAVLGLMAGEAVITNGVSAVPGWEAVFFPRRRSQTVDLFADVVAFEDVTDNSRRRGNPLVYTRTNVDIAVRLQIPKGKGVLLLQGKPGNVKEYQAGFILDPL